MSVEFNEEGGSPVLYSRVARSAQPPKLVLTLVESGLVKDERQARYVCLFLVIALFLLSAFLLTTLGPPEIEEGPDPSLLI